MDANDITGRIITAAMQVHTSLGPGLLESVYSACLCCELTVSGIRFESQKLLPVTYRNLRIDSGLRIDLIVEDQVIVELKAVERILPVHHAQLLAYLRLSRLRFGLLINFNVPHLRSGIKRMVNGYA